jgi:hypothetical protein
MFIWTAGWVARYLNCRKNSDLENKNGCISLVHFKVLSVNIAEHKGSKRQHCWAGQSLMYRFDTKTMNATL